MFFLICRQILLDNSYTINANDEIEVDPFEDEVSEETNDMDGEEDNRDNIMPTTLIDSTNTVVITEEFWD